MKGSPIDKSLGTTLEYECKTCDKWFASKYALE